MLNLSRIAGRGTLRSVRSARFLSIPTDYPKPAFETLVEMQLKQCQNHADKNLFGTKVDGKFTWLTYGDFDREISKLRTVLVEQGLGKDDKVDKYMIRKYAYRPNAVFYSYRLR
jgi:hypothetical protein